MGNDVATDQLIAETNLRGETLRCGEEVGLWEEGDHPYGKASPCHFCEADQTYTNLFYNGPGSPPSYAWSCHPLTAETRDRSPYGRRPMSPRRVLGR